MHSRAADSSDLWWKNATFYCLDVQTFCDGDGDGYGDFMGLTEKVGYLAGLGVDCIWLMPFFPSPNRDDGYDVSDHYAIDPRAGNFGDFTIFMRTAAEHGLRVIADLVVNHTSVEHAWFQAARTDPTSRYRDWYVFRDEIPTDSPEGIVFPDEESSVWEWDDRVEAWYLHRFYAHQPDLNVANPEVRDEVLKVVGFWLAQGLSGFRVDAVPFFLETGGIADPAGLDPHGYLRDVRAFLSRRRGDALLLGEVNLPPEDARAFFGDEDGDELQMLFDFVGMQGMYLGLARKDATPLAEALRSLPAMPDECQWGSFVRNHDELTLDKLTKEERGEVFAAFGPDPDMQLFDRGLRRRLPPMLDGDTDRIRLVYSLMFSLPGAPVLFYGEEIGMGENLAIDGRLSVRTPMQWSDEPSAGFSTAPPQALTRPLVTGDFGPAQVNVAAQRRDAGSLYAFFRELITRRRETPEIGFGAWRVLDLGVPSVLGLRFDDADRTVITLHNLDGRRHRLELEAEPDWAELRSITGDADAEVRGGRAEISLGGYGARWLRVVREGQRVLP